MWPKGTANNTTVAIKLCRKKLRFLAKSIWTTSSEKQYDSARLMSQAYWGSTISFAPNSLCEIGHVSPPVCLNFIIYKGRLNET